MKRLSIVLSLVICLSVQAQQDNGKDEKVVTSFIKECEKDTVALSPNELLLKAAWHLMGTPYVGHTLEVNKEEQLVINLRELDCMTFVDNCLALSRTVRYANPDFDYFARQLKYIRYRNGIIQGYTSRLHYTSDWITDNINKNVVEDITHGIGGKKFYPEVSIMSTRPELYPALKSNPADLATMKEIENIINKRTTYYYLPKNEIKDKQHLIKDGDIICFVTSAKGVDIAHLGIAYRYKGGLTFIHASSKHKKVLVNPESLSDYCKAIKSNRGIIVLRSL
ncbi:hypothetical protein M2138_000533 [Dysgonomonadaceae bacterium PH5-43]|nr:hypothetical protein [Dysgonomonadaceae bacterium PH5-43]